MIARLWILRMRGFEGGVTHSGAGGGGGRLAGLEREEGRIHWSRPLGLYVYLS